MILKGGGVRLYLKMPTELYSDVGTSMVLFLEDMSNAVLGSGVDIESI